MMSQRKQTADSSVRTELYVPSRISRPSQLRIN